MFSASRVRLEKMTSAHVEQTWSWLQDPVLRRAIDCFVAPTPQQNAAYWRRQLDDASRENYAIILDDGEHVGNGGLMNIDFARRKAELWIYLGAMRQRGIGQVAVAFLLERGFRALELNRISLRVLADNVAALQLYKKFGFVEEGCAREDTIIDGVSVDAMWLSLLRREYVAATVFQ